LLGIRRWRRRREGSELFDRTQADTISLAESAIDGAGFGHAHLGPADKRRDVRRISVTEADESARPRRLVDSRLEDPASGSRIREVFFDCRLDTSTAVAVSHAQQTGMRCVPATIEELQMAGLYGQAISFR
jgi:hypothetical protein